MASPASATTATPAAAVSSYGLDALELRALSMPSTLLFLLGVEYDIFRCVTRISDRTPFTVRFPAVGPQFRKLLALCAARFGLRTEDVPAGRSPASGVQVVGTATVPLLRYADFLPGQLHMDEILAALGVHGAKLDVSPVAGEDGAANIFAASFISYAPFLSDDALGDAACSLGHYLQLEYGLSLATHSHLVEFVITDRTVSPSDAVAAFQLFCGWTKFDLRFQDDRHKRRGVLVMPSVQDAIDIFEKYEDEDSDEEDCLPFSLRPVCPMTAVPFMEDSQLRKMRQQHWPLVVKFWQGFASTRNCIVVSNLYDKAQLEDVLKIFDGLKITASALVSDNSPFQRRRAFITFADGDAAREALGLDGKNTHGKALRMQASPPYIDDTRRGTPVRSRSCSPSPQVAPSMMPPVPPEMTLPEPAVKELPPPPPVVVKKAESGGSGGKAVPSPAQAAAKLESPKISFGMNAEAKEFVPRFLAAGASPPLGAAAASAAAAPLPPPPPPPYKAPVSSSPASLPPLPPPPPPPPLSQAPPGYNASPGSYAAARSPMQTFQPPAYALPPPYTRTPPQPQPQSAGKAPPPFGSFNSNSFPSVPPPPPSS